jgi:hypothetical protein
MRTSFSGFALTVGLHLGTLALLAALLRFIWPEYRLERI